MKLKHITFTGVDGKTDLDRLQKIQDKYPIAEFGILVSSNWKTNGNRYFNPSYLSALSPKLHLSAHLCGRISREAVNGNMEPFEKWLGAHKETVRFQRCQLNIANSNKNPQEFKYDGDITKFFGEVILQQKSAKDCPLFMNSKIDGHVTCLLDASGGHGIDTGIEVLNLPHKIGYAGGMNPDNVADKLSTLLESDAVDDFWIDMESGVRTDDWFDLDKVEKVLEICTEVIENHSQHR